MRLQVRHPLWLPLRLKLPQRGETMEADIHARDDRECCWIAVVAGILALSCYFFSAVLTIFPRSIDRILFHGFGACLALSAITVGFRMREKGRWRPFSAVGIFFTCVAGMAVNMMAVIQDSNFTMMSESIREAELESTKEMLKEILWGINWVQLSFDIWIAGGTFFLALGALLHLGQRRLGITSMLIAAMALGVNFATLPHPPAESGLSDPGPFVATWMGVFLGLIILWTRQTTEKGLPGNRGRAGGT